MRPGIRSVLFTILLLAAALAATGSALPASAASTITISTCNKASLDQAINDAASGDTIVFDCSGTISVKGSGAAFAYSISKDLTIDGSGQDVTIDGGGQISMFFITMNVTLTLENLTFNNGAGGSYGSCLGCTFSDYGGVITNQQGTINIENSTFTNGTQPGSSGGGAILSTLGTVNVSNSTFSNNSAYKQGGAIESEVGTLKVTNSTFTGNRTSTGGAGIGTIGGTATIDHSTFTNNTADSLGYGAGVSNAGTMTITNSTFSGNQAETGGAIANSGTLSVLYSTLVGNHASWWANGILTGTQAGGALAGGGITTLSNTILANGPTRSSIDGTFPFGGNCVTNGTLNDGGGNYSDDETCGANHVSTANLYLGSLANNGGPTQTIALSTGSVAINAVACISSISTDQRGFTRSTTGSTCDAGAYEFGATLPVKTTALSSVSGAGTYGSMATLTATLKAGTAPISGKTITFTLNSTTVGTATTDSSGVATLANVSLSGMSAGSYPAAVGASFAGDSGDTASSGSGTLTVNKADQTISFDLSSLPAASLGDAPIDISSDASSSSSLTIAFSSTTTTICTVSGSTVTLVGLGICTIQADQTGDTNYNAAAPVQQSFAIIDTTPPTTSANATAGGSDYTFGNWTNQTVTVTLTAVDTGSGVASTTYQIDDQAAQSYSGPFDVDTEGLHTVTFFSVDQANNTEATQTVRVKIDLTAPTISGAPTTSPNGFDWYNGPVSIHWTCADAFSGVASCPSDTTIATEGVSQSVPGTVTDLAGNAATATSSPAVNIDLTAPTNVTGTPDRAPNGSGWYNSAVTITFSGTGDISGIDSCTSATYSGPDSATALVSGSCTDKAGNTSPESSVALKYDATAPVITYTGNAGSYRITQTVTISCDATDSLAGVASTDCQDINAPAYSFTIGSNTIRSSASDAAGNSAQGSVTFIVTASATDLTTLTGQFASNRTLARQLSAPLGGIALAERMHNERMKTAFVNTYILLVNQQRGRGLTNQEADTLIRLARTL